MTWTRQVLHVAAKDIRQWKVMYALFVIVVLVATAHGMGLLGDVTIFEASLAFVILAGMLLVAFVIQGDSPTRADAFWASRPIQPSAVASAKVMQGLLVILIALVGQAIALVARGVSPDRLFHYLPQSAGLFALWLAAAIVAAALTKDVQGAIVAFVGIAIVFGIAMVTLDGDIKVPPPLDIILGMTLVALALGLAAFLYTRRARSMPVMTLGALAMFAPLIAFLPEHTDKHDDLGAPRANLELAIADSLGFNRSQIPLRVRVPGINSAQRADIEDAMVTFTLSSGRTIDVGHYVIPLALGDSVPMPMAFKWIRYRTGADVRPTQELNVHLEPDEQALLAQGVQRISLSGIIKVMEPQIINTFPLEAGEKVHIGDHRLIVERATFTRDDAQLTLNLSGPTGDDTRLPADFYMMSAPQFALVNESRKEAVPINGANMSSRNSYLVLPGASISDQTFTLSLRRPAVTMTKTVSSTGAVMTSTQRNAWLPVPLSVDGPWLKGAKLLLLAWHPKEHYRISGTLEIAP